MTHRLARHAAFGAVALALFSSQAHASIAEICLTLPAGAGKVEAKIASGCLPTSPAYEGVFDIAVKAETATIQINGGFEQVGDARIGTADCMGMHSIEQEAQAAGPRRYSVVINDRFAGVLDASDTTYGMREVEACFAGPGQVQLPAPERMTTYMKSQFKDWLPTRPTIWGKPRKPKSITAETLGGLAAQLLGNHPESQEGRQNAQITISPGVWRRNGYQKPADYRFMAVRIEEHGYLDDSVSGRRTFAAARQHPQTGQWRVTEHWYQFMCARGENAGQWTSKPCP
ncbi:MAG: hypothetical protein AAFR64_09325 [Pseudomonadota bacterium]